MTVTSPKPSGESVEKLNYISSVTAVPDERVVFNIVVYSSGKNLNQVFSSWENDISPHHKVHINVAGPTACW